MSALMLFVELLGWLGVLKPNQPVHKKTTSHLH